MDNRRSTVSARRAACILVAAELLTALAVSPLLAAGHPSTAHTAIAPGAGALTLKPTVHRTNGYQIGAYYFSGWSHGPNNNLPPLLATSPLRKYEPLIGWYDDSQAQVDKNILQAAAAGIDFFAFDWYDTARSPYATDKSLNEGLGYYLRSRQRYRLNFCLTFIDQGPFLPRARGKPLFIIFSPEHMRDIFGSSTNVRLALNNLRAAARKASLPGVTIAVAATLVPHYNPARVAQLRAEGYDVATGYNYHAMGPETYRTPVPYSFLVRENRQMWDRVASQVPIPYIPVITSGWDERFSIREQETAIIYAGRTPAQFSCYAAAARQWVDTNAWRTVKERMVLVFAWNEVGEGGSIIPTKVDRYGYTQALHRVFTAPRVPVCR